MKKIVKRISVVLGAAAMAACFAFAGCAGTSENFVDGPEYSYRVTDKTDELSCIQAVRALLSTPASTLTACSTKVFIRAGTG